MLLKTSKRGTEHQVCYFLTRNEKSGDPIWILARHSTKPATGTRAKNTQEHERFRPDCRQNSQQQGGQKNISHHPLSDIVNTALSLPCDCVPRKSSVALWTVRQKQTCELRRTG